MFNSDDKILYQGVHILLWTLANDTNSSNNFFWKGQNYAVKYWKFRYDVELCIELPTEVFNLLDLRAIHAEK